jgi:hypothetical protein
METATRVNEDAIAMGFDDMSFNETLDSSKDQYL